MPNFDEETLSAFVDGDLSTADADAIEAAIAEGTGDAGLKAQIEELRTLKALAREVRPEGPPRDLWPQIEASLQSEGVIAKAAKPVKVERPGWIERIFFTKQVWMPALGTAMAAVAILMVQAPWEDPRAEEKAKAVQQFQVEIHAARTAYLTAIQKLAAAAESEADRLPPKARAQLEKSLATVDQAIAECEATLQKAPNDPFGHETLVALYDEKIRLLQAALDAAQPLTEGPG